MKYLAILIFLMTALTYGQNRNDEAQNKKRYVRKETIISPAKPPVKIKVNSNLKYLGELNFSIKDSEGIVAAEVNRFIFAAADKDKKVHRIFIAQFESLLPAHKKGYSFQVKNATRLGAYDYQTDSGLFNFAQASAQKPGAEADYTKTFFAEKGLNVDDNFMTARYARIAAEDKRSEVIFFYQEALSDLNVSRADIEPDDITDPRVKKVVQDFIVRALGSFKVIDDKISK